MVNIEDILPRRTDENLKKLLIQFSKFINSGIDIALEIMIADTNKKRVGDEHLPPLLFFRNIIELCDAISILIQNSSIDSCKPLLRTLLENSFGLEYMLERDTEIRSLSYIVWHTNQTIKLCNKLDYSTEVGKQFEAEMSKDKLLNQTKFKVSDKTLALDKKNSQELLMHPKYLKIQSEYERTDKINKNPNWYSLYDGPKNVKLLAKYLRLNAYYEIIYRGYSNNIHATDVLKKKIVLHTSGQFDLIQIRFPGDAQSMTQQTFSILLRIMKIYLDSRVPELNFKFEDWYSKIRDTYLKLGEINFLVIE